MEQLVLGPSATMPSGEPAGPSEPTGQPVAPEAEQPATAGEDQEEAANAGRARGLFRLPFLGRNEEPATAPTEVQETSFGAEQLAAREDREDEPELMTARVIAFEEALYQRLRVELDNGQIWEQRDSVPPWRLEQYGAPDEVEIFPSRFGGYRMRLIGKNLVLSVDRVR